MRVRQQRVSPRRSLLLGAVAAVALLSGAPTALADGHKNEPNKDKGKSGGGGGVKVEKSVTTHGGLPDTVIIETKEGDKTKGEPDTVHIAFKECQVEAGRGGEADLTPVFAALKGCPTGLVTLLSQAEGGPPAYSWSQPSNATDIPNLLIYGSRMAAKGKKDDDKKKMKINKGDAIIPPVTVELSGTGPLRTGPWAANDVAFTPSATAELAGVPFEIKAGDADLSNVMFSGFEGPVFKVSEDYTLKILGGLFTDNHNNDVDATLDVEGGTLYCHRCHFSENEGTAIKAAGADSLVGLSFSKFVNNTATEGLIQAANSRGGFASTSFINNTVASADGAVLSLTDGSLFLGHNALFRDNVGGDLRAEDSHFRIDKSLFKGSALHLQGGDLAEQVAEHLIPDADAGAGADAGQKVMDGSGAEEPAAPLEGEAGADDKAPAADAPADAPVDSPVDAAPADSPVDAPAAEGGVTRVRRRLQAEAFADAPAEPAPEPAPVTVAEQEGSVARLYGASSFRGFNNFFDGTQGPAILALDASNVTLGRPCFTNDAPGADAAADGARFVEAGALEGNLTLWGACAFPTTDNTTALYGAADVVIDGMEAESVALTPFSALAIGGEATGTMAPQNGSCVKHCATGFVPPQDWDPAARPPPGKKNSAPELKFDEKTGTVSVAYPADYKGPQIPAFKLPFPPGISISVAGPHKKARRSLRAGAGASFLDRVLKGAKEAVRRRAQFPFVIPFAIPEDISKQLGISSTPPAPPAPVEGDEDIEHEHEHEEFDEDDVDDLVISLFAGTMVPPPPEEVVTIAPPTLVIATDEEVVVATATATAVTEETETEDEDKEEAPAVETPVAEKPAEEKPAEEKGAPLARLQNDVSAPWDNAKDADKWNKPDWSFLANFPAIPNSAAGQAHGKSEKQKEAIKAARAYDAYMAFIESNPGVALPSSAAPAAPIPTETDAFVPAPAEPAADAPAPEPENIVTTPPQEGSKNEETTTDAATPEATAEPTAEASAEGSKGPEGTAAVCPEGETPLVLYLDSGSTGEYESCTAETNGTAAFYFVAKAGEAEARTFVLPEGTESGSFALMQVLDLGCQPPSNVLEVELRNELAPNVTCARWLVPNWADQLAGQGTAVTIDKATGEVKDVQEASEVVPVPTPEPTLEPEEIKAPQGILPGEPNPAEPKPEVDATEPVASEEPKPAVEELVDPKPESTPEATEGSVKEAAEDAVSEEAQQGAERRHRRHRRRLQAAATTTTYDIAAETEAAASPEVPAPVAEPVKEQAPAADAPAAAGNTTTTIVAVPIDLGESEGGSGLKVVCITDSQSLAETYQIEFNMPGIKATVVLPGAPAAPVAPEPTAEPPLPAGGEVVEAQADESASMQQKKSSNAGAAAGGVIGALIGLAAVAALVVVIRKRRQGDGLDHALAGLEDWNVRRP